jgi:glycosyltransferase involved in cell wall biosynthesis
MATVAGGSGSLITERSEIPAHSILYVGTLPPHNGGSAMVGYQLLVGLARIGHRIRAIAPITPAALEAGDDFVRRYPEIAVTRFVVPFFNSSPDLPMPQDYLDCEDGALREAFRRAIAIKRPDLVIIGRESFAQSIPELASSADIPSMLLVQGSGLVGMMRNFAPDHRGHLIEQFKKVDLVVAVARHLIAEPLRALGFREVVFIANPVDLKKFSSTPKSRALLNALGIREGDFVVTHISNMKAIKRASDIIRSAREVIRRVPHARFVMVGDGICRAELEAECRSIGLFEHFRFTGWIDHDAVPDYINLADAVVMPSETEAAALVYLETQACARVLIASDIAGAREVIRDGETGLLFRKGEVDDLTAKLLLVAGDANLRERIGRAAREAVKAHDVETFVANYDRTIRGVVIRHRARQRDHLAHARAARSSNFPEK